ncbi:MAG: response regulator [Butyrivibrio sp.]|nr:response regulator [Butyrivibrio sp.]
MEKQKSVRVKLGTIAVAEGLLTEEQAEDINLMQRMFDKRFGDIAVDKGWLTLEQIEELLAKQGNAYLQFVQLLTELTGLTATDADQLLKAFQKDSGYTDTEMAALKADDTDQLIPLFVLSTKPHIREIAALVIRNLTRFISSDFYIGKALHVRGFSYNHMTCQELAGDDTIFIGIAAVDETDAFLKVASAFSHEEIPQVGASAYDAVGEFINVTNGLFATELSKKEIHLDMEPPVSFTQQTALGDFYAIPVYLEGSRMDVLISVNEEFIPGENPEHLGGVTYSAIPGRDDDTESLGKVLVVDDSRMSRSILRNLLEKAGYSVIREASNGEEAIEAYKECKPDLVTLDITMPKMDGLEALTNILAFDADARVIMITAAGQQDKLIKALKEGAKRFINKPFNEEEILKNIRDVLQE